MIMNIHYLFFTLTQLSMPMGMPGAMQPSNSMQSGMQWGMQGGMQPNEGAGMMMMMAGMPSAGMPTVGMPVAGMAGQPMRTAPAPPTFPTQATPSLQGKPLININTIRNKYTKLIKWFNDGTFQIFSIPSFAIYHRSSLFAQYRDESFIRSSFF